MLKTGVSIIQSGVLIILIPTHPNRCKIMNASLIVFMVYAQFSYASMCASVPISYLLAHRPLAFDCARVWGISGHKWVPTILVAVLSMSEPAINLVNIISQRME